MKLSRICVFLGANPGIDPVYAETARSMGRALAEGGIGLVYGGSSVGLMGILADEVMARGGEVLGVIPQALSDKEIGHRAITRLEVVASMHERKARMAELADGFVALPGGIGTLEEIFEVFTWGQLGFHKKPCALLDVRGYYTGLCAFLDHVRDQGFLKDAHRSMLLCDPDPARLLERMAAYEAPTVTKWVERAGQL